MSVQAFLERQRQIMALLNNAPECWLIIANGVFDCAEGQTPIAVFDTREQAEAYVDASLLPSDWEPERKKIGDYWRSFRPDSLLWDFNPEVWINSPPESRHKIVHRLSHLLLPIDNIPHNPAPPTGEMPPDVFAEEAARRLANSR